MGRFRFSLDVEENALVAFFVCAALSLVVYLIVTRRVKEECGCGVVKKEECGVVKEEEEEERHEIKIE